MKGKVWAAATPPPPANLASQITVRWASNWGAPTLGNRRPVEFPARGLPTLGSCFYAAKGALIPYKVRVKALRSQYLSFSSLSCHSSGFDL
jgi:hypothetical protein